MKRAFWGIVIGTMMLFSVGASADSVQLTGVGGGNQGGVYVVPYFLSINGADPIAVMCDDYSHEVYISQTWDGHISDFSDLSGTRNGEPARDEYVEIAWLYDQWLADPGQAGDINFAAWAIFTPGVTSTSGWTGGAAGWLSAAQSHDYSNFNTSDFRIITPDDLSSSGPQEYITKVPEPSSLILLGSGFLGLARKFRRK